jgi:hypothetical protein
MDQHRSVLEAGLEPEHRALDAQHFAGERQLVSKIRRNAKPADQVAAAVEHQLNRRRMRPRTLVGTDAHVILAMKALLPARGLDAVWSQGIGVQARAADRDQSPQPKNQMTRAGGTMTTGVNDIVWHNAKTGETQIWLMDRHRIVQRVTVVDEAGQPIMVGLPFSIVGVGDVNRDGGADIVWHNAKTGETQIWLMDRHRIVQRVTVVDEAGQPIMVGLPFSIVGVGDVDRNIAREAAEAIDRFHHDRLGMLTVGPALSAPRRLAAGAFEQQFKFGTIMKPLNREPVITSRFVVAIAVAAIKCFGTEDPSGEDEPYLISAIYAIDPMVREGAVQTARIDFGAVSERQVFGAGHQLAQGFFIPGDGNIRMRVALWDQESARPANLEKKWGEAAKIAIIAGLTAAKPPAGGAVALLELATGWVSDISKAIGGVVADIFGDNLIAERDFVINADFLSRLVREGSLPRTSGSIPGFRYNFPETPEGGEAGRSWLFEGGGGSYRIFFAVRTARIDLSPLP